MPEWATLLERLGGIVPIFRTALVVIILLIISNLLLRAIKKNLLARAKTKKQISNIEIFSRIFNYLFALIIIISAIFSYSGSWTGLGLTVGLISAALGWALQKPITGIAAWIMIVAKRPFDIGDRIIVGGVKGDVVNVTLTHIYIKEIGGIVEGEESSGRIIMIPNSLMFDQNIVNYTFKNEYILDQVVFTITHQSNLEKAMKIAFESAKKNVSDFFPITGQEPYVRTWFQPNGINVHVRYFAPAVRIQEFSSKVTREIHQKIMKSKDVSFAYPHTAVVFRNKMKPGRSQGYDMGADDNKPISG